MTRRRLLALLDKKRVEAAIADVEAACAIELRISIAGLFWGESESMARRAFDRLQMGAARGRNGILVLLAPWRRKVVVFADEGITAKVEAALWSGAVSTITAAFHEGNFTDGLVVALADLARALAPHFPPVARSNELPDQVDH